MAAAGVAASLPSTYRVHILDSGIQRYRRLKSCVKRCRAKAVR